MRRYGFVLCLFTAMFGVFLSTPAPTHAQNLAGYTRNPYIQRGLSFYNDQKYPLAIKMFLQVDKWPRSSRNEKIMALQYLGFIHVILGNREKAKSHFMKLLTLSPKFRLVDATIPPKFVRFFNGVVKTFKEQRNVKIISLTPEEVPTNKRLVLKLRLIDHLGRAKRVALFYRLENSPRYFQRQLTEVTPDAQPAPVARPAPKARTTPPPAARTAPSPRKAAPAARTAPEKTRPVADKKESTAPTSAAAKTTTAARETPVAERKATTAVEVRKKPTARKAVKETAPREKVVKPANRVKGTSPSAEHYYSYTVPKLLFATLETTQAYYFEFYVIAYDSNNKPVAKLGSPKKPVRVKRIYVKEEKPKGPPKAAPPFYKTWWFWTLTGVVVAGGVTAGVVAATCCNPTERPKTGEAIITVIK